MKPVTEYFLLTAINPVELAKQVNHAITHENKQPYGYPFVIASGNVVNYGQAMAFYRTEAEHL